jgi:predicted phosphodiesterase
MGRDDTCIAVFGGVYNNYLALEAVLADARVRGATAFYCLGDMGGFGPYPDRVFPLLHAAKVTCIQGNYDHSVGNDLKDCGCGYTDPRDNYYAQISYEYTNAHTAPCHKAWLRHLPPLHRRTFGGKRLLMAHGSPRRVNEFLWESTTPAPFLSKLLDGCDADVLLCTHTGIHWQHALPDGRLFVNVGAIGRPANDGRTEVWYALLTAAPDPPEVRAELIPVAYDHARLAAEIRDEGLPEQFAETILTGWWTTCLEVLPARERARGKY